MQILPMFLLTKLLIFEDNEMYEDSMDDIHEIASGIISYLKKL